MELKTIPKFPAYRVSKNGKVWSVKRKQFLTPTLTNNGYFRVTLRKNLKTHGGVEIHRLILQAFVGPCPKGMVACHNNGISTDNRLKNLRWDTIKNNIKDAMKHGTSHCLHQNGEANPNAKLKEKDVRMVVYMHRIGLFSQKEIAKIYNMGYIAINNIIAKRSWKHIWN